MDLAVKRSLGYGGMYAFTVFIEDKLGFNGKLNLKDFSYFSLSQIIVEIYRKIAPEHYVWAMVWTLDKIGKENYDIADDKNRKLADNYSGFQLLIVFLHAEENTGTGL